MSWRAFDHVDEIREELIAVSEPELVPLLDRLVDHVAWLTEQLVRLQAGKDVHDFPDPEEQG